MPIVLVGAWFRSRARHLFPLPEQVLAERDLRRILDEWSVSRR